MDSSVSPLCDVSMGRPRPIVPMSWRCVPWAFSFGPKSTAGTGDRKVCVARDKEGPQGLTGLVFVWRVNVRRFIGASFLTAVPELRFDHKNVDRAGPLPLSRVFTHLPHHTISLIGQHPSWPRIMDRSVRPRHISVKTEGRSLRPGFGGWLPVIGGQTAPDHGSSRSGQRSVRVVPPFNESRCLCMPPCVDRLPWVMLDLQSSSAELISGQPLWVPNGFSQHPWSHYPLLRAVGLYGQRQSVRSSGHDAVWPATAAPVAGSAGGEISVCVSGWTSGSPVAARDGPFRTWEAGDKCLEVFRTGFQWIVSSLPIWTWTL
ncbi:uncharacterized protein LOC132398283 [Hypanus sabinus]|uniref:uncharacterized protein LOC132398283 n=1 Tax=Hypanus sabinus TaxID=79690 RepID=UPI0028C4CA1A|nr:uncharacterized protein LOC132398283 [Hypanus sabinus]XP_059833459.1 uncharacterized protein LOC132398283 [Hypanus sabinus]